MDVFNLVASLVLDSSDFDSGLDDAEKEASSWGSRIGGGLKKAGGIAAAGLGVITTGAVAAVASLQKGAADVAEYGDHVDKMSQKLGISAEAYQEWDAILRHSGASIDGMQATFKTLQLAAEKNDDAFEALGITQEQLASMSTEDLFAATITALQNMEEGSERTALATQLLGRGAMELGPLLNTSAEDTEAMREQVHLLGGVMSDEAVKAAAAYQDSLQDMRTASNGLKNNLMYAFLPGVTGVMDGITAIFSGDSEGGIAKIKAGIDGILDTITEKLPEFISTASGIISAIVQAIVDNLPSILAAGGQIVGQLIAGLINSLPTLIGSIPALIKGIIKGLVDAWPDIKAAGQDLITQLGNGLLEKWATVKAWGGAVIGNIKAGIVNAWENLKAAGRDLITKVGDGLVEKWETVKAWGGSIVDRIKSGVTEKWQSIVDAVKLKIDALKSLFDFDWSLPKLKMPHFTITDGPTVLGVTLPTIGVEWYKKAYENPFMFTKPTVMGFGDGIGGEMVYGHENLMRDIRDAVGGLEGGNTYNFNVTVNGAEYTDEESLAERIAYELRLLFDRENRAYA